MKKLFIIFSFFFHQVSWAQNDSLLNILLATKSVKGKLEFANNHAPQIRYNKPDLALEMVMHCVKEAKKSNNQNHIAESYILLAEILSTLTNPAESIDYLSKAKRLVVLYKLDQKLDYKIELFFGHNYFYLNDFRKSLKHYKYAENLCTTNHERFDIYRNIASAYQDLDFLDSALIYYNKAIIIDKEMPSTFDINSIYNNMMIGFMQRNMWDSAYQYEQKLEASITEKENYLRVLTIINKAEILNALNKSKQALDILNELEEKIDGDFENILFKLKRVRFKIFTSTKNIAMIKNDINHLLNYQPKDDYGTFAFHVIESYKTIKQIDPILFEPLLLKTYNGLLIEKDYNYLSRISEVMADLYLAKGNCPEMKKYLELEEIYMDSIRVKEGVDKLDKIEYKHFIDQQFMKDSIQRANQDRIQKAEQEKKDIEQEQKLKEQSFWLYSSLGVLSFIFLIVILLVRSNRQKVKANQLILQQKLLVEEQKKQTEYQKIIIEDKQKEIIDSINYARRLQQAILTPEVEIKNSFTDSFLLYKPKDIVAGDFYFFEKHKNYIFYAAADCTGHGVPGALMSIVCSNALQKSIKEFDLIDPGQILDKTKELVVDTFRKSGNEVKDGMDISLLVISSEKNNESSNKSHVIWAGANNPLWVFEGDSFLEIKGDKQPVGLSDVFKPFTSHKLEVSLGTTLFMFTDGYPDQFGGPKGKKFKYSNLQRLLLENKSVNLSEMKLTLENSFENWRGDLEQVDDVCVIGIKI